MGMTNEQALASEQALAYAYIANRLRELADDIDAGKIRPFNSYESRVVEEIVRDGKVVSLQVSNPHKFEMIYDREIVEF